MDRLDGFTHYTTRMLRTIPRCPGPSHPVSQTQGYGILAMTISIYGYLSIYLYLSGVKID